MALRLQVDVQQHAQALQLVGQKLVARPRAAQLLVAHVDLALHGLRGGGVGGGGAAEARNSAPLVGQLGLMVSCEPSLGPCRSSQAGLS